MTSALRRIPSTPQITKVISTSLYSKLKLEDLYDFDNEVRQKLLVKMYPAKSVDQNIFNQFLSQTFIVNGILSDRYKSLHHTHQVPSTALDCIKRIQARYENKNKRIVNEQELYKEEVPLHMPKRKKMQSYLQEDVNLPRKRRSSRLSSPYQANKIYPSNLDDE